MLTKYQLMAIATEIGHLEQRAFGDTLTIASVIDAIRKSEREMEYYYTDPLEALKMAEGALTDVINLIDQANDDRSFNALGKQADQLMDELQREIRYAETPAEDRV